jgi:hypothetical protein
MIADPSALEQGIFFLVVAVVALLLLGYHLPPKP